MARISRLTPRLLPTCRLLTAPLPPPALLPSCRPLTPLLRRHGFRVAAIRRSRRASGFVCSRSPATPPSRPQHAEQKILVAMKVAAELEHLACQELLEKAAGEDETQYLSKTGQLQHQKAAKPARGKKNAKVSMGSAKESI